MVQRGRSILTVTGGGVVDELWTELGEELQPVLLHGLSRPRVLTVQLLLCPLHSTTLPVPDTLSDRGSRGRVSGHSLK